jgi:hypothetical protein
MPENGVILTKLGNNWRLDTDIWNTDKQRTNL